MPTLVNETSKLANALQLHPDVLDYIVSLNPHDCSRLRNPLMRRLMPPRITLTRIAKMTNTSVVDMLVRIHEIAGRPLTEEDMKSLERLAPDDVPVVKHKWEPQPLYDIWSKQGVEYYSEQQSDDEWWIYLRWHRST